MPGVRGLIGRLRRPRSPEHHKPPPLEDLFDIRETDINPVLRAALEYYIEKNRLFPFSGETVTLYRAVGIDYLRYGKEPKFDEEIATGLKAGTTMRDWLEGDLRDVISRLHGVPDEKKQRMITTVGNLEDQGIPRDGIIAFLHTNFNMSPWLSATPDPCVTWDIGTNFLTNVITLEVPIELTVPIWHPQKDVDTHTLFRRTGLIPQGDEGEVAIVGGILPCWVKKIQTGREFMKEHAYLDPTLTSLNERLGPIN